MDTINVTIKHTVHENIVDITEDTSVKKFFIYLTSSISAMVSHKAMDNLTTPTFINTGSTLIKITTIPTTPTPDFNNPKLERTVSHTSDTALPTMGIPLDTTNFNALEVTLSPALDTELCIVTIPENINIDILIIQVTHFLILLTIPSKDISGHIPLMHEIAKLMLINGRIILSAN